MPTLAGPMEQHTLKNVSNGLNTNINSYLETYGGQSSNLYLNVVCFFNTVFIRHLWHLKNVVLQYMILICAVLFYFTRASDFGAKY
jgi:hypothetical protein